MSECVCACIGVCVLDVGPVPLCVCVCACKGALLVILRHPVSGSVYFWVSDSVSMAADASDRKALRYKQTLVSVLLVSSAFSMFNVLKKLHAEPRLPHLHLCLQVCCGFD